MDSVIRQYAFTEYSDAADTATIKYMSLRGLMLGEEGLDRTYIKVIFQPDLKETVMVAGFPGAGGVGIAAANLLVEFLGANLFAELYSPLFPDYTPVDSDGVCSLLKYSFFVSTENRLVILVGEEQPPPDEIPAYYELCGDILDFVEKLNCITILTVDGIPSMYPQRDIYVAGTSKRLIVDCVDMGARVYTGERIIGLSGLLLGLAKLREISGACILSTVTNIISDDEAAFNSYRFLRRILRLGLEKTI
ncbi:MAG: PAC2 family protein [Candidatus Bathyarchaeia archaeon]